MLLFYCCVCCYSCFCCCYWSTKPTFKVWLKFGQEPLRYWWHWVCGGGGCCWWWWWWWWWCKVIFVSNQTFELSYGWVGVVTTNMIRFFDHPLDFYFHPPIQPSSIEWGSQLCVSSQQSLLFLSSQYWPSWRSYIFSLRIYFFQGP